MLLGVNRYLPIDCGRNGKLKLIELITCSECDNDDGGVPVTNMTEQFLPEFEIAANVLIVTEPFTPPPRKWERDKISTNNAMQH